MAVRLVGSTGCLQRYEETEESGRTCWPRDGNLNIHAGLDTTNETGNIFVSVERADAQQSRFAVLQLESNIFAALPRCDLLDLGCFPLVAFALTLARVPVRVRVDWRACRVEMLATVWT